ncbi:formylglycine-generating enzyme family protein [Nitrospirales bacterium NOB]|nr:formylglycine-generating enzyme family protein [Nitrospirales bacterium NOB]
MTGCRAVLQTCVCLWLLWAAGYVLPIQADPLPDDMVLIPAGEFTMGTAAGSGGLPDEQPLRRVYLGAFWIDRYEATNTDYQRFVEATGYQAPAHATAPTVRSVEPSSISHVNVAAWRRSTST